MGRVHSPNDDPLEAREVVGDAAAKSFQRTHEKYGRHRAALAATLVTYRHRMAVRDVAKALGYPTDVVDALAKSLYWFDGGGEVSAQLAKLGLSSRKPCHCPI